MYRNPLIRKAFGILLIAAFALSNTPIKVLHHLFANHIDYCAKEYSNTKSPQLNTAGIDCHCQSNVVVSPYTYSGYSSISKKVSVYTTLHFHLKVDKPFSRNIPFGLRGPPLSVG